MAFQHRLFSGCATCNPEKKHVWRDPVHRVYVPHTCHAGYRSQSRCYCQGFPRMALPAVDPRAQAVEDRADELLAACVTLHGADEVNQANDLYDGLLLPQMMHSNCCCPLH